MIKRLLRILAIAVISSSIISCGVKSHVVMITDQDGESRILPTKSGESFIEGAASESAEELKNYEKGITDVHKEKLVRKLLNEQVDLLIKGDYDKADKLDLRIKKLKMGDPPLDVVYPSVNKNEEEMEKKPPKKENFDIKAMKRRNGKKKK